MDRTKRNNLLSAIIDFEDACDSAIRAKNNKTKAEQLKKIEELSKKIKGAVFDYKKEEQTDSAGNREEKIKKIKNIIKNL